MNGLELVYRAVDDVNANSDGGSQITKSPETALLGNGSKLDSLQLVNLVSAIEMFAEDDLGKTINLVDESVFSAPEQPLNTLGSLAAYVDKLIA